MNVIVQGPPASPLTDTVWIVPRLSRAHSTTPAVAAEEIVAGQAFYTDRTLPNYDLRVLTLSNPLIWRCPTSRLLRFFDTHVSANHLDVGVGTGYFLDKCRFPTATPPKPRRAPASTSCEKGLPDDSRRRLNIPINGANEPGTPVPG